MMWFELSLLIWLVADNKIHGSKRWLEKIEGIFFKKTQSFKFCRYLKFIKKKLRNGGNRHILDSEEVLHKVSRFRATVPQIQFDSCEYQLWGRFHSRHQGVDPEDSI